uniref:Uncharacterized protein n=1 Tax=Oryza punctata TaxID=4537 RepID=A0A0E0JJE2_ORYPU
MRPARRGWGVGALARPFLVLLLLLAAATTIGFGCRGAEAIRVIPDHGPAPGNARSSRGHGHRRSHGGARVVDAAMPVVGTRPVPARPPAADEESKRRIPSCPDPLHNRGVRSWQCSAELSADCCFAGGSCGSLDKALNAHVFRVAGKRRKRRAATRVMDGTGGDGQPDGPMGARHAVPPGPGGLRLPAKFRWTAGVSMCTAHGATRSDSPSSATTDHMRGAVSQ